METKEELIKRIIKEQDLVCFYIVKPMNKSVDFFDLYSADNNLIYLGLRDFILSNPEILHKLSTKNLMNILSVTKEKEKKEQLLEIISKRLRSENLFLEDIDNDTYMIVIHSSDEAINKIGEEDIDFIIEQIRSRIAKTNGTRIEKVASYTKHIYETTNFLEYFEQGIFDEKKITLLEKMIEKDENTLQYVNFGIFKDEIFNIGNEFIEYISKFPAISTQMVIIANHNPNLMQVLGEHIRNYATFKDNLEEIEILITYFAKNCFKIDLDKNININDLIEEALQSSTALISLTRENAQRLIQEYGMDIDNIEIGESEKQLIYKLKEVLNLQDEEQIELGLKQLQSMYKPSEILRVRNNIAKACAKSYVKEMNETNEYIKQIGQDNSTYIEYNGSKIQQIKLNGKFNMLLHSTDTGFILQTPQLEQDVDFVQLWNCGKDKENHVMSTTLINQDFLGTSPVGKNGVRYAFVTPPEENIKLMGVTDINTYSTQFAYNAKERQYMSAKTLPYVSRRVYNEFGIEREGVMPNYVVIFDDDIEEVKNNSYKAAQQFNIPVIFIDKKEIEQQQMDNLKFLITKFNKEGNIEDLKSLINCYETNRAGWLLNRKKDEEEKSYTGSIDNSRFEQDFDTIATQIETVVKTYLASLEGEKADNSAEKLVNIMEILLREMELYKDCDQLKPISKTELSFNAEGLIEEVNATLSKIRKDEYTVNIEQLQTKDKLTIKEIVVNALTGENAVNIDDVDKAMQEMNLLQERGDLQHEK